MATREVFRARDFTEAGVAASSRRRRYPLAKSSELGFPSGRWPEVFVSNRVLWRRDAFAGGPDHNMYHGSDGRTLTVFDD